MIFYFSSYSIYFLWVCVCVHAKYKFIKCSEIYPCAGFLVMREF